MAPDAALIVLGLSARGLAEAAVEAGFRPLAFDLFRDQDTQRFSPQGAALPGDFEVGLEPEALLAALDRVAADTAVIWGSGFEGAPALLNQLATRRMVLGTAPADVARLKDPMTFAAVLAAAGIPHPEVRHTVPADPAGWLLKRAGGLGGGHIRPASTPPEPGDYVQRHHPGRPVSACLLGDGADLTVLGFSDQWTAPAAEAPWRYGGAVRPSALPDAQAARIATALRPLAGLFGLKGLASADLLVDGDDWVLLEVNPRPGATLDVFRGTPPVLRLHVEACRGRLPLTWEPARGAEAAEVIWAERDLTAPAGLPRWVSDRPVPGSTIPAGAPVCTIRAGGRSQAEALRRLDRRRSALWRLVTP